MIEEQLRSDLLLFSYIGDRVARNEKYVVASQNSAGSDLLHAVAPDNFPASGMPGSWLLGLGYGFC